MCAQVRDVGSVFLTGELDSLQELNLDSNLLVEVSGACQRAVDEQACITLRAIARKGLQDMCIAQSWNT